MAFSLLVALLGLATARLLLWLVASSRRTPHGLRSLRDKHILVTDSSQPALVAAAELSLLEGAYVTLLCRDNASLSAAQQALQLRYSDSLDDHLQIKQFANIQSAEEAALCVESAFKWRPVDVLIFSYGTGNLGLFDDLKMEEVEKVTPSNLMAAVYTARAAIRFMKQRSQESRSALVFVSSSAGVNLTKGARVDSITDYALKGLAELLRFELLQHNIGVHFVIPGAAASAALCSSQASPQQQWRQSYNEQRCTARVAEKVARCILDGVKKGHFLVTVGVDAFLVGVLARGCIPADSWLRAILEFLLLIPLRLLSMALNSRTAILHYHRHKQHTCSTATAMF